VHHVESVTKEFLEYLEKGALIINVYINPFVETPAVPCGTHNAVVVSNIKVAVTG
jgi:hypothetical protein